MQTWVPSRKLPGSWTPNFRKLPRWVCVCCGALPPQLLCVCRQIRRHRGWAWVCWCHHVFQILSGCPIWETEGHQQAPADPLRLRGMCHTFVVCPVGASLPARSPEMCKGISCPTCRTGIPLQASMRTHGTLKPFGQSCGHHQALKQEVSAQPPI